MTPMYVHAFSHTMFESSNQPWYDWMPLVPLLIHAFSCTMVESSKSKLLIVVRLKRFQKTLWVTVCTTSQKLFVPMTEPYRVFLLGLGRLNAGSAQPRRQFVPSIFFSNSQTLCPLVMGEVSILFSGIDIFLSIPWFFRFTWKIVFSCEKRKIFP